MDLFKRKRKELPPLMSAADFDIVPEQTNYEAVLNWLIGLSADDYAKVGKVADIHRKAYYDASKVLGLPDEATTFINPPEQVDDLQTLDPIFLEHEPAKKAKSKSTKVSVKDEKDT